MAKEIAIGKRAKITEAQQYMLLSVLGASIFLGAAIALVIHFVKLISFNTEVIMAEEQSIATYSDIIKNTGICKAPSGSIYSEDELKKCDPESIEVSEIPGTLRSNILENVAANDALNSVPNESNPSCINPETKKNYTYKELRSIYDKASGASQLQAASQLIKSCSALRVIPDALPAFKNEEALLASLNQLFIVSNWNPESISPAGDINESELAEGLNTMSVNLLISADTGTTMNVLNNIERSIREFDINSATISWQNNSNLELQARATAYYVDEAGVTESTKTISAGEETK